MTKLKANVRQMPWRRIGGGCALAALAACSGSGEVPGNLGNGTFDYTCVSADDPACPSTSTSTPSNFPAALASGAHFKVTYSAYDTFKAGNPTLKPVAPEYISALSADGSFTALKPGKCGIVARSSVDGLVFDFTFITISPISSLGVTDENGGALAAGADGGIANVQISNGATAKYLATALGPRDEKLAGSVDYNWSVSDATVLQLGEGNPTAHINVSALKAGTATLTVTQGAVGAGAQTMTVSIPITVTP